MACFLLNNKLQRKKGTKCAVRTGHTVYVGTVMWLEAGQQDYANAGRQKRGIELQVKDYGMRNCSAGSIV